MAAPLMNVTENLQQTVEQNKAQKHARNAAQESQVRTWVSTTLSESIPAEVSLFEYLKDGTALCRLINKLQPDTIKKINPPGTPFKERENIENYLRGCSSAFGMASTDLFATVDLYENGDPNAVVANLSVLRTISSRPLPDSTSGKSPRRYAGRSGKNMKLNSDTISAAFAAASSTSPTPSPTANQLSASQPHFAAASTSTSGAGGSLSHSSGNSRERAKSVAVPQPTASPAENPSRKRFSTKASTNAHIVLQNSHSISPTTTPPGTLNTNFPAVKGKTGNTPPLTLQQSQTSAALPSSSPKSNSSTLSRSSPKETNGSSSSSAKNLTTPVNNVNASSSSSNPEKEKADADSLTETIERRRREKFDPVLEAEVRRWLEAVLGESLPKDQSLAASLRDGIILCRMLNKLKPDTIKKINEQKLPFKQMENIENYSRACKGLGIPDLECFNTVDLYEEKDFNMVLAQLSNVATHAGKILSANGEVIAFDERILVQHNSSFARKQQQEFARDPKLFKMLSKLDSAGVVEYCKTHDDISSMEDHIGQNALHLAAATGQTEVIDLLLSKGVKLNQQDKDGLSPVMTAAMSTRLETVEFLLQKQPDVKIRAKDGTTLLHLLTRLTGNNDWLRVFESVLKLGAKIDVSDESGNTPLSLAAASANDAAVIALLKRAANPNATNAVGETSLHRAAKNGNIETMKILIDQGGDMNLKANGLTVLEMIPNLEQRNEISDYCDPSKRIVRSPRNINELMERKRNRAQAAQQSKKLLSASNTNNTIDNSAPSPSLSGKTSSSENVAAQSSATVTSISVPVPSAASSSSPFEGPLIMPNEAYVLELGVDKPLDIEIVPMPFYYRWNFAGRKHWNFVGFLDEAMAEPAIVSLLPELDGRFRVLFRSKEGCVESMFQPTPGIAKPEPIFLEFMSTQKRTNSKSQFVLIENLRLQSDLLDFEEHDPQRTSQFPIGVVYSAKGNQTQWDMWNNQHGSADFEEFVSFLGERVKLQGWTKYAGGLDVKHNSKGKEGVFTHFHGYDIMYHVSTYLPFAAHDDKKLQRSRMIGNDITMIIFQEGDTVYNPATMTGSVSHVFMVVRPVKVNGQTKYRVGCCRKDFVPMFGPEIPNQLFERDEIFRNLLLTKLINGHSASQASPGLKMMYSRPRHAFLEDLVRGYAKHLQPGSFGGAAAILSIGNTINPHYANPQQAPHHLGGEKTTTTTTPRTTPSNSLAMSHSSVQSPQVSLSGQQQPTMAAASGGYHMNSSNNTHSSYSGPTIPLGTAAGGPLSKSGLATLKDSSSATSAGRSSPGKKFFGLLKRGDDK